MSGYVNVQSGNWLGIGNSYEGVTGPLKVNGAFWRLYFYEGGINRGWDFLDTYDNWATFQNIPKPTSLDAGQIISTGPVSIAP